jgi:hypothetical protein
MPKPNTNTMPADLRRRVEIVLSQRPDGSDELWIEVQHWLTYGALALEKRPKDQRRAKLPRLFITNR